MSKVADRLNDIARKQDEIKRARKEMGRLIRESDEQGVRLIATYLTLSMGAQLWEDFEHWLTEEIVDD